MAESIASIHNYSRTVKELTPSFVPFEDHSYGKKRARETSGLTPDSKRVDLGTKQQEDPQIGNTKTKWSEEEKEYLFETVQSSTAVHTLSFWKKCSGDLNEKFGVARTGPMCRMLYKRQLKEYKPPRGNAVSVGVQTEPAIPVLDFVPKSESMERDNLHGKSKSDVTKSVGFLSSLSCKEEKSLLGEGDKSKLLTLLLNSSDVSSLAKCIFNCNSLKENIWELFLGTINEDANSLKERRSSYLYHGNLENLTEFKWEGVIEEMCSQQRFLTQVLLSVLTSENTTVSKLETWIKPLSMVYGILMKNRIKECSRLQRVLSMLLANEQVHQKVYDQLQPLGVCLSHNVTSRVLNQIDGHFNSELIQTLKDGKKFRIIGDNVNFMIDVSNIRKASGKKAHMEHWFASAAIVQNVSFSNLSAVNPICALSSFSSDQFVMQNIDWEVIKSDYVVLIARVLCKFMPWFQPFKKCIPKYIKGDMTDSLTDKNKVIPLPVLAKNEQKYTDVMDILDHYESVITHVHDRAGRSLENDTRVHIGGDQLTRERFSGAKRLRSMADSVADRYVHLSPISFEFFHLQMKFLSVIYKHLYNEKSTEPGMLNVEKTRLDRSKVDGNDVKNHYEDCKELAVSFIDSYIVEAAQEFFGMESCESSPQKNYDIPPQIDNLEETSKWLSNTIGRMIDEMVLKKTKLSLSETSQSQCEFLTISICMPDGSTQNVQVPISNKTCKKTQYATDDLHCYAGNVLELGLLFKDLSDVIKLPDKSRMISILKYIMLVLKADSNKSKYALEILRFLYQHVAILSDRTSHESFYGLFVNTTGKIGNHIPADLQMEHLVKNVKSNIKGLHSNKTERAIAKKTGAFAGMCAISANFDKVSNVLVRSHKHHVPGSYEDELLIIKHLRKVRPFQEQSRKLTSIKSVVHPISKLDSNHLRSWMESHKFEFYHELGQ